MTANVSISALKRVRKKYGLSDSSSLSSAQFREAQNLSKSTSSRKKQIFNFSFRYEIEAIDEYELRVSLIGRHLSKNQYNTLPQFDRKNKSSKHHYVKAMKTASENCRLLQKSLLGNLKKRGVIPFDKSTVHYTFFNVESRDHDNNGSDTIKPFQDTFTTLGLIVDDSRKHLMPERESDEVLISRGEEYKVVAVLKKTRE